MSDPEILRRVQAAEAELAEARRLLAAPPSDPCDFQCTEFETQRTAMVLRVSPVRSADLHFARQDLLLDRKEALDLRRILTAFIGDSE